MIFSAAIRQKIDRPKSTLKSLYPLFSNDDILQKPLFRSLRCTCILLTTLPIANYFSQQFLQGPDLSFCYVKNLVLLLPWRKFFAFEMNSRLAQQGECNGHQTFRLIRQRRFISNRDLPTCQTHQGIEPRPNKKVRTVQMNNTFWTSNTEFVK